jgi:high-affinity Fe2+/Pb2+ permease
VSNNPNASVTALAGAVTILLVWIVSAAGLNVPAEVASAFTTLVAAFILWVGRRERKAAASSPQASS